MSVKKIKSLLYLLGEEGRIKLLQECVIPWGKYIISIDPYDLDQSSFSAAMLWIEDEEVIILAPDEKTV